MKLRLALGVFKVLMWKHYIVRKRRFVIFVIELFTPFLMFLCLIAFRSAMDNRSEEFRLPVLKSSLDSQTSGPRILYTPDTELSRMLMDQVGEALYVPRFDAVPKKYERSYLWSNESQSGEALNALQSVDAVIVFENLEGDILPDNLNYTVRVKAPTKGVYSLSRRRSYEQPIDLGEEFIRLQWAIDSSFIKLKSTTVTDLQNITVEQFRRFYGHSYENNRAFADAVFFALDFILFLGPLLSFVLTMIRLTEEKSTGIQELIEMMGVTPSMLGVTHFLNSLPPCLLFSIGGTMLIYVNQEIPLETHPLIIFFGLFLHFITMIAMAFACSYITKTSQHTMSVSMFAYIGSWIPICLLRPGSFSQFVLFLKGLLPHAPSFWFIYETYTADYFQHGVNFENWSTQFHKFTDGSRNGSMRMSYMMQLIQIAYFFTLAWYLKKVRPGKFGVALPWNFLCQKEFWMKYPSIPEGISNKSNYDAAYSKYFEDPPDNLEVAVNVVNVRKIFNSRRSSFVALDNVSLKFYKGEITVLVGHNGAGKTTLISIIAGMIMQSSGKVYVEGLDTVLHQAQLRKKIALCPQHNLFFPNLTVQEHLMFFSLLKGGTNKEAMKSSEELLKQLDLTEKASWSTSKLSGGLLRRLQIGCTLCSDASILLLDEPTSGLDIDARRELWDILLMLRGERTVIMTTHFLDEADILGDRIVALHSGTLRCCATPSFLKKAVGSGFRVSITTVHEPDVDKITKSMRKGSPEAILKDKNLRTLVFDLPPGADMTSLFNSLEYHKIALGIESLGVGAVSLEEAFMELCSDVETKTFSDREENLTNPDKFNYTKGRKLILIQMRELFKRQFDYTVSKLIAFIFIQFLVPFVMCILLTQLFTNANEKEFFVMDLNVYSEVDAPVATYNYRSNSADIVKTMDTIRNLYPNLILRETNRNHNKRCTCKKCKEQSKALLTRNIIDVYVDEQEASLRYDPTVKHSAAVGLNLLSNIIASQRLRRDGKTINMQLVFGHWPSMKPKDEINCILFVIFNIFIIMATAINDVALPCRERITNSRYLHIMAGCPPVLYWIVTLVYHMTSYMLLYCSGTMVAAAFFDTDHTFNNTATLKAYFLGLFLCGISFYVFAYFLSYFFNEKTTGVILLTLVIIFGLFTPLVMFGFKALGVPLKTGIFFKFLNNIGVLIPAHMFTQTIKKMTDVSRFNAYCSHYYQFCPARTVLPNNFDTSICCDRSLEYGAWFNHFTMSEYGMGKSLLVVIAQIVVFTSLVLLLEYRLISRLWSEVEKRRTLVLPTRKYESSDVAEEKQYVSNTIIRSKGTIKEVMLVNRTWKAYFKLFEKPTFALKDLNYSVKEGECFGIIGLNGAGKTTNFKVITRQEYPTRGTIYANGYFADAHPAEYLRGLGYCPQSFGFDNFRTGEDNLRILMALRGLSKEDIKNETRAWLTITGLHEYGGRRTVDYSGGMTRRLAVGAALCGGAHATLLDEPTAGVDTAAKRQVWLAVKRALTHGRCVVLSSHNMDEVERLCNRVTILDSGEMGALGTPNRYKELYAPGHTAVFKLRVNSVLSSVGAIRVQSLKDFMDHEFDCFLKDEHLTTLRFTIMENLAYNVIFIKLGFLAAEFDDIVEDYSAYDANMEDAFMHFVKESRYSIRPNETW